MAKKANEATLLVKEDEASLPWYRKVGPNAMLCFYIACYSVCSCSMLLINKAVVEGFPHITTMITMIQMGVATVLLCTVLAFSLHFGNARDAMLWIVLVVPLFAGMLITSMLALKYASVGFVTVFRNIAPFVALPLEHFFQEKVVLDVWTGVAMFTILGGIIIYVWGDASVTGLGVFLTLLNLVFAVVQRVIERRMLAIKPIDVSKSGMVLMNNFFGIFFLLPVFFGYQEQNYLYTFDPKYHVARDWIYLTLSCILGLALGWCGIKVQSYVHATTMMVLTNSNKVVVVLIGMWFLHDSAAAHSVIGACVALTGGAGYGYARYKIDKRVKEEKAAAKEASKEVAEVPLGEEGKTCCFPIGCV